MSDDVDIANDRAMMHADLAIKQAMKNAANIPGGEPGECVLCGEEYSRLINKTCARCRDANGLG